MKDGNASTIRQCPRCSEWTPTDRDGCVHCDRAKGIITPTPPAPSNGTPSNSSYSTIFGCFGLAAVLLLVPTVLLTQCKGKPPTVAHQERDPAEKARSDAIDVRIEAERNLRMALKDGESAKLDGLFVSRLPNGAMALCGRVNAKNSFGAYTGYKRFIAGGNAEAPTLVEDSPIGLGERVDRQTFNAAYRQFCANVVMGF